MSKSFSQAPKPPQLTAEAISAFERGGPGQDTRNRIPSIVGNKEPTNVEMHKPALPEPADVERVETTNVEKKEATKEGMKIPTKVDRQEPIRRLSIDLPVSWHRRFKIACTKADKKMIDEVTDFIKRRTVQLEKD